MNSENKQTKKPTNEWIKKYFSIKIIIGILLGILGGYLYYIKIGCSSGSCPITSSPWLSMLWGALLGYLTTDLFPFKKKK